MHQDHITPEWLGLRETGHPVGNDLTLSPDVIGTLESRHRACGWLLAGLWVGIAFTLVWLLWKALYCFILVNSRGADILIALPLLTGDQVAWGIELAGRAAAGVVILVGQYLWFRSDVGVRSQAVSPGRVALAAGVGALGVSAAAGVLQFPFVQSAIKDAVPPSAVAGESDVLGYLLAVVTPVLALLWARTFYVQVRCSLHPFPWGGEDTERLLSAAYLFCLYAGGLLLFAVVWLAFLVYIRFILGGQLALDAPWRTVGLFAAGTGLAYCLSWVFFPVGVVSVILAVRAFAAIRWRLVEEYNPGVGTQS